VKLQKNEAEKKMLKMIRSMESARQRGDLIEHPYDNESTIVNMDSSLRRRGEKLSPNALNRRGKSTRKLSAMKQALKFLDYGGSRLGILLRRNAHVRIFLFLYIIILHLWMVYILWHFTHHSPALQLNQKGHS